MGWMLSSLMDIEHPPPLGVFPLGTGNDLSRSYGWVCAPTPVQHRPPVIPPSHVSLIGWVEGGGWQGPVFASASVAQVREWLLAAVKAVVHPLDSWQIAVLPPDM